MNGNMDQWSFQLERRGAWSGMSFAHQGLDSQHCKGQASRGVPGRRNSCLSVQLRVDGNMRRTGGKLDRSQSWQQKERHSWLMWLPVATQHRIQKTGHSRTTRLIESRVDASPAKNTHRGRQRPRAWLTGRRVATLLLCFRAALWGILDPPSGTVTAGAG